MSAIVYLLLVFTISLSDGLGTASFRDLSKVFLRAFTAPPPECPWVVCASPLAVVPSLHLELSNEQYSRNEKLRYIQRGNETATYCVTDIPILEGFRLLQDTPYFRQDAPTIIYAHGYIESAEAISVRTVVNAYLRRGDHNIIVVDWSDLASQSPLKAALSTYHVGEGLARVIDAIVRSGFNIASLHLIGHSMGGHVTGFTGSLVKSGRIPRITALDPVGIAFYATSEKSFHLDKSDADFLDVIHTDSGHYGVGIPIGHVDSYPNGGRRVQPGCPLPEGFLTESDLCSHWLSWRLYAESLVNTDDGSLLLGRRCQSWTSFQDNNCNSSQSQYGVISVGFYTPARARGTYYLTTNGSPVYGKGLQGIVP